MEGSELYAGVSQEPGGQATQVPFRANVRTWAQDDIHAMTARELDKSADVQIAVKAEAACLRLVQRFQAT